MEPGAETRRVIGDGGVMVTLDDVDRPRLLPGTSDDNKPEPDGVDELDEEAGDLILAGGEGIPRGDGEECNDEDGECVGNGCIV